MHTIHMPIVWRPTEEERVLAMVEARRRQSDNERKGLKGRNNGPEKGDQALSLHLIGAIGEVAVASFLGLKHALFQESQAKRGSYDIPPNIDVKTRSNHDYDLICFQDESPDKVLVLVTVQHREIRLHGWTRASNAKRSEWWHERVRGRGCYYVPQQQLLSMESLRQCLAAQISPNTLST